jgi:basic amino acid/polyamine antiporter, APA family
MWLTCKEAYIPKGFKTPLMPFLPGLSILLNTFLLGTLELKDYQKFGWFLVIITIIYLVYSIHAVERARIRAAECATRS